jgi:hypothetical protein
VPSHSADRSSSRLAAVASPVLEEELAAPMPVLPAFSAAGNRNDLHHDDLSPRLPAIVDDAGDVTGNAPGISGTYIYGFDSAGNPTLTDAPNYCSPDRDRPH